MEIDDIHVVKEGSALQEIIEYCNKMKGEIVVVSGAPGNLPLNFCMELVLPKA